MSSYGSIREEYVAAPSSACSCAPGGAAGQTGAGAGLAGGCRGPAGAGRCWRADCRGRLQDYEARILSCSSVKVLYRLRHVQF